MMVVVVVTAMVAASLRRGERGGQSEIESVMESDRPSAECENGPKRIGNSRIVCTRPMGFGVFLCCLCVREFGFVSVVCGA